MQFHALCLAAHLDRVDLVGCAGTRPIAEVAGRSRIRVHALRAFPALPGWLPRRLRGLLFVAYAPAKISFQIAQLTYELVVRTQRPRFILLQNPPSIPTLAIAWLAARVRGARLVVDWHNLGWTLLPGPLGWPRSHPVVLLARRFERFFGAGRADAHLCVTKAMQEYLRAEWGVRPGTPMAVLHDLPHARFRPLEAAERRAFLASLEDPDEALRVISRPMPDDALPLLRRAVSGGSIAERKVALVISSTSWTPDEDFSVLLDALVSYNADCQTDLLVFITGKGPEKEMYEQRIARMRLDHVKIVTVWLSNEHYPLLLGSCDVGVSLHQSSSQLDLPMKILDMFGAGLPVVARTYPCLEEELVEKGATGLLFSDSETLYARLDELFNTASDSEQISRMRSCVIKAVGESGNWASEWEKNAWPLLQ
eukprot:m51a1_g13058 putative chitobiosyldiphosphodolichol beta-mannosyltransferase-like (424) ;mRNA; r:847-2804